MEERDGKIVLEKNREGGHDGQAHRRPLSQNPPDAVPCVGEPRQFQLQLRPRLRRSASASASASCVPGCPRCRAFTAVPLGSGYDEASSSSCCCCPNWVSACGKSKTGSDVARLSSFPSLAFPPVPLACGLFFFFFSLCVLLLVDSAGPQPFGDGGLRGGGRRGQGWRRSKDDCYNCTGCNRCNCNCDYNEKDAQEHRNSGAQHSTAQHRTKPRLPPSSSKRTHQRSPRPPARLCLAFASFCRGAGKQWRARKAGDSKH